MDVFIIIVLICISSIWMVNQSKKKFGYLFNPILLFVLIFFLHNWSLSFSKIFYDNLTWYTPNWNPEKYQLPVLMINLSCLWSFYIGVSLVNRNRLLKSNIVKYNFKIYGYLYYFLTLITIFQNLQGFGDVYGESQAENASSAFSPFAIILLSRVIWGIIFSYNSSKRTFLLIILLEIIISILTGGRKSLIIILSAGLIVHFEFSKIKLNFIKLLKFSLIGFFTIYFVTFIATYREISSNSDKDFEDKVELVIDVINSAISYNFMAALNSANSEAVQIWTYQLIENNELKYTYGLSYVQAFVNTVILRPFQGELVNYQAAYYFKNIAYPDLHSQGFDFTFTAEGILNWGYFACISYLILGYVIGKIYYLRNKNNFYDVLYIIVIALLYVCLRTDSTTFLRYISYFVISFWFFKIFKLIPKKNENNYR